MKSKNTMKIGNEYKASHNSLTQPSYCGDQVDLKSTKIQCAIKIGPRPRCRRIVLNVAKNSLFSNEVQLVKWKLSVN